MNWLETKPKYRIFGQLSQVKFTRFCGRTKTKITRIAIVGENLTTVLIVIACLSFGVAVSFRRSQRSLNITELLSKSKPHNLLLVVSFFGVVIFVIPNYSDNAAKTRLRGQFHLSKNTTFLEFRRPRRASANKLEGIVQFTEAQFDDYRANLSNKNLWKPVSFGSDSVPVDGPFSYHALDWQKLPMPNFAGTRPVRWGNLSRERVREIKHGRVFCVAHRRPPGKRKSKLGRPTPKRIIRHQSLMTPKRLEKYIAMNCTELGRSENPVGYVLGVLDFEKRMLHMIVR